MLWRAAHNAVLGLRPKTLTSLDLAHLRGLYKSAATASVRGRRDEIVYQMDKSLGAKE